MLNASGKFQPMSTMEYNYGLIACMNSVSFSWSLTTRSTSIFSPLQNIVWSRSCNSYKAAMDCVPVVWFFHSSFGESVTAFAPGVRAWSACWIAYLDEGSIRVNARCKCTQNASASECNQNVFLLICILRLDEWIAQLGYQVGMQRHTDVGK